MAQTPVQIPCGNADKDNAIVFEPRSYQLEMLEASRKENIIVAMDTGSGKTQVAFLRIMEELERGLEGKRIWFLAPTVALCTQHHENIRAQLPAVEFRLLLGSDNVDRWSNQQIWDTALRGIRVVISTHAVLADALSHGFVKMEELNLLVFDEGPAFAGLGISNQSLSNSEQLRKFYNKAYHLYEELGSWAADYYILESVRRLKAAVHDETSVTVGPLDYGKTELLTHLMSILESGINLMISVGSRYRFSPKLNRLISFLVEQNKPDFSGLIFVQQRATANVMSTLLSVHPETKSHFRSAGFVGLSNSANRRFLVGDLTDAKAQSNTLADFREGRKNLIVTTEALEEGIDILACHLVVSYNKLPTLKSFVQRRGRARQRESIFGIMVPQSDPAVFETWQRLEKEMISAYMSASRILEKVENIEEQISDTLQVSSTGAFLTADLAVAHLYHFCNKLPPQPYVTLRPTFSFKDVGGLIRATASLPNCVNRSVRETQGIQFWRTENAAVKDAALQAYKALYAAGLVSDNLLPLYHKEEPEIEIDEKQSSKIIILAQVNPWIGLAKAWSSPDLHEIRISAKDLSHQPQNDVSLSLILPSAIPLIQSFHLYWNKTTTFQISLKEPKPISNFSISTLQVGTDATDLLLRSARSTKMPFHETDFVALFIPSTDSEQLSGWLDENRGSRSGIEELRFDRESWTPGILRTTLLNDTPLVFRGWKSTTDEQSDEERNVVCIPLPKRREFMRKAMLDISSGDQEDKKTTPDPPILHSLPITCCTFDRLPFELAQFSLFIPAILGKLETTLIATQLSQTIVKEVKFKNLSHIITAISAPSALWTANYERYEFLGDSILKFIVSAQLYADHTTWHEGYLTKARNTVVCNARLAKAGLTSGLDAFVLTTHFSGRKWIAPTISELLKNSRAPRHTSRKVLADVVEALIGAAFLDQGITAAQTCIHVFLPEIRSQPVSFEFVALLHHEDERSWSSEDMLSLGEMIDYKFINKSILFEALTHPSCQRDAFTESYQRLEFLGDAVLDMIVASSLFAKAPDLSQGKMTQVKAALVNSQYLGFLAMDLTVTQGTAAIHEPFRGVFSEQHGTRQLQLWQFMRHHSREVTKAQQECLARYQRLQADIYFSLSQGKSYPWVLLTQLNAEKFLSDLVEAVLGAIFIDSRGDLAKCERFAKRLGVLEYLNRIICEADAVDVSHPKTVLGRLANSKTVEYAMCFRDGNSTDGGVRGFFCEVRVGDDAVAAAGGCATKEEAELVAAQMAVERLNNMSENISCKI